MESKILDHRATTSLFTFVNLFKQPKVINLFFKAGSLPISKEKSGGVKHWEISGNLNIFST